MNTQLKFDEHGHLAPAERIEVSLDDFQRIFVDDFPESETRQRLFGNYLDWVFDFKREVYGYFTHWIDGSFVTRKLNPNDLDFLTILDPQVYDLREQSKSMDKFWTFSTKDTLGLDAYIIADYPKGHPKFERNREWLEERNTRYIIGREGPEGALFPPKGYLGTCKK